MSAYSNLSEKHTYRIGVDVGGTNTDAVLLSYSENAYLLPNRGIKAAYKHPTTPNVHEGIELGIKAVIAEAGVDPRDVSGVMIGTTHFINAVVSSDKSRLSRVAVLRLGYPYTLECPPFIDFPPNLRAIVEGYWAVIHGGRQIDGSPINAIDKEEVRAECRKIQELGISAIVIVGVFSPLDQDGDSQEEQVRDIIVQELGEGIDVVCSRDVARVGLLERENASILNASILRFARHTVSSFMRAIIALGLRCPLYLTQNDGTLTTAASAAKLPIKTFASGATNSMRGASYLAGLHGHNSGGQGIMLVDIGGTSTDVGILLSSGFPRQAAAFIEVGGVRTNFSMPDVHSIALGGGSIVRFARNTNGQDSPQVTVGPDSVGYNLTRDALVFGGSTVTATDIVVASSSTLESIGDASRAVGHVSSDDLDLAQKAVKRLLEGIVDKMKPNPNPIKVLLVGGGSIVAPAQLDGVEELIRPPYFSCANAVGAAVASVSGEVDVIESFEHKSLEDVVGPLMEAAKLKAINAGARAETVSVVEVDDLPIQYVTNKMTRIIVRAIGELNDSPALPADWDEDTIAPDTEHLSYHNIDHAPANLNQTLDNNNPAPFPLPVLEDIDIFAYRPSVTKDGTWILSEKDLEWIQEGCGILGAGGGGSPYPPFLMAREIMRSGGVIKVINPDSLPDEAVIVRGLFMGSPSVSNERLQSGGEIECAVKNLTKFAGISTPAAVISDEIGGGNGIQPMILASQKHLNIPVFDGDLMGRAYPNMYQSLPAAFDVPNSLTPCAIADGVNNSVVLPTTSNKFNVEAILRNVCTFLGSKAGVSMAPLTAKICREYGVVNTVSQAWRLGRAVAQRRKKNDIAGIPSAILELQTGNCTFIGKIMEIDREVRAGFTWGYVRIAALQNEDHDAADFTVANVDVQLRITFQNEFLMAVSERPDGVQKTVAVVPDLITLLDTQSGISLGTHELRYGLRVTCIVMAGDPKWTTPKGLACGGPRAFGLDVDCIPVGSYKKPRSVIEEYLPSDSKI